MNTNYGKPQPTEGPSCSLVDDSKNQGDLRQITESAALFLVSSLFPPLTVLITKIYP